MLPVLAQKSQILAIWSADFLAVTLPAIRPDFGLVLEKRWEDFSLRTDSLSAIRSDVTSFYVRALMSLVRKAALVLFKTELCLMQKSSSGTLNSPGMAFALIGLSCAKRCRRNSIY